MKLFSSVTGLGCLGIFKFRNGEKFWTLIIKEGDDLYRVRYEHGWYEEFREDGTKIHSYNGEPRGKMQRDIVEFEPVESSDSRVKNLQWGVHP